MNYIKKWLIVVLMHTLHKKFNISVCNSVKELLLYLLIWLPLIQETPPEYILHKQKQILVCP